MDNITHAFVGAAFGESALPPAAAKKARLVFLVAGIAAASAPDLDLLYTGITEKPLGYLLHHRGHTHTWPGLVVLALVIAGAMWLWPAARQVMKEAPQRFWLTIAAGLASHLLMDAGNSYGAHLFWPWRKGWAYGDTIFILEPWLWLILGVALTMNAKTTTGRIVTGLFTVVPILGLAYVGLISPAVATALLATGAAIAAATRSTSMRRRAIFALAASAAFIALLAGLSSVAEKQVRSEIAGSGEILDVVLDPNPGAPWCWSVLSLQKTGGELVGRRGTLSLAKAWPSETCATSRFIPGEAPAAAGGKIAWKQEWRTSLAELQKLEESDCRAKAWLQFARVPLLAEGRLADLRFENSLRENFTSLPAPSQSPDCPKNLTSWEMPRRELFGP